VTPLFGPLGRSVLVDRVAAHQNSLRLLDHGSASERPFEVVELGEAAQHDVNRSLELFRVGIGDVGRRA
jgi:hypothetical protein